MEILSCSAEGPPMAHSHKCSSHQMAHSHKCISHQVVAQKVPAVVPAGADAWQSPPR